MNIYKCLINIKSKNGSTQNRTGVLRTKISYAAPTPWNHLYIKYKNHLCNKKHIENNKSKVSEKTNDIK